MARQNHGPLSRAKGKLGGVVYQQYEGMQISREYQPVVKNPQTNKQVENRAKFKNASQFLSTFKETITIRLAKVSIYNRFRRAVAINALYRIADITGEEASQIALTNAVSAINEKSMTDRTAPDVTVNDSSYSVTAPGDATVVGVIAGYSADGTFIKRKVVNATSAGSSVTFPLLTGVDSQNAMFLYTIASSEEGRALYGNMFSTDGDFTVETTRLINEGALEVSDIAGITHTA